MIYFTADTHFDHANILKLCNRPFADITEMNETMITGWNKKVTNADTIYIVGDLLFRTKNPEAIISRLKGKKHLIIGNHDRSWLKKCNASQYFESIDNLLFASDGEHRLTLCHYPMMTWPQANRGCYMIYGHIHANTNAEYWPLIERSDLMLNAGVDVNNFAPVTFDEMIKNNRKHRAESSSRNSAFDVDAFFAEAIEQQKVCDESEGDDDGDDNG